MEISIKILQESRDIRDHKPARTKEITDRLSGKKTKEEAKYRPAPRETKESCIECKSYSEPGQDTASCRRVAGVVYGQDVCDLFAERR